MVYVVLGMHKSGTSLIAELLHRSGIPMVEAESDADYQAGNKWERTSTLTFDKDLLEARGVDSLSITPPDPASLLREVHLERARLLVARIAEETTTNARATGDWGFKDPRACLTWPVWRRVLTAPRIVAVYRHPSAVVRHFQQHAARLHRTGPLWRLRVEWLALRRWREHNERVLDAIEVSDGPSILLSYERLMRGDEELAPLRRFLGCELADPRKREKRDAASASSLRAQVGARAAQLTGAGSAPATFARLEAKRTQLLAALGPPRR